MTAIPMRRRSFKAFVAYVLPYIRIGFGAVYTQPVVGDGYRMLCIRRLDEDTWSLTAYTCMGSRWWQGRHDRREVDD